jgi:hypothetical protein
MSWLGLRTRPRRVPAEELLIAAVVGVASGWYIFGIPLRQQQQQQQQQQKQGQGESGAPQPPAASGAK